MPTLIPAIWHIVSKWRSFCFCGYCYSICVWACAQSYLTLCHSIRRSCSWMVLWRPTEPSRTNTPKRCPLHYRGLECKSKKSRAICTNRQICPWSTKQNRSKVNRVLQIKCTGHSKHPLPKSQEKTLNMDITRWSIPKSDWLFSLQPKMEKLYSQQKQVQELTVAQIMNSLLPNSELNWSK